MIYLDNNATTKVHPEVVEAIKRSLEIDYGNPSSAYRLSTASKDSIEKARQSVADFLGANDSSEIAFTSGGTESDNWAVIGALEANPDKQGVVTTTVEHEAVRVVCDVLENNGFDIQRCGVNEDGQLSIDEVVDLVSEETAIVSIMLANNETGVIFPVEEIAERIKQKSEALIHVDGVNAAGKVPIDLKNSEIDLFSISAHKFHGPKGIGALYIRQGVELSSRSLGGGQEFGRRAGTEAVHQIVGIGKAAELASDLTPLKAVRTIRDEFEEKLNRQFSNARINGAGTSRLPNTTNVSFENLNGEIILAGLDEQGVCVSTGSACNETNHVSSPVLRAMGVPYSRAMGTIRFSFGRFNSASEIDPVLKSLSNSIGKANEFAGK